VGSFECFPAILLNQFEIKHVIGSGRYGAVLKCSQRQNQTLYAIKVIKSDKALAKACAEFCDMPHNENVVKYISCWIDSFKQKEIDSLKPHLGLSLDLSRLQYCNNIT